MYAGADELFDKLYGAEKLMNVFPTNGLNVVSLLKEQFQLNFGLDLFLYDFSWPSYSLNQQKPYRKRDFKLFYRGYQSIAGIYIRGDRKRLPEIQAYY